MTTLNLQFEAPKTTRRTILAVGRIHYQPAAGGQTEILDVTGWMLIEDDTQPADLPDLA